MPRKRPDRDHRDAPQIDDRSFFKGTSQAHREYGRFNLAIVGGTGVGKSSLVNAVFKRDEAQVGKGLPVTQGVHYYHDDALGIWDVEGFEIGSASSPAETLRGHLRTIAKRPADEQVSVVWYCLAATSDRLTQPDIEMIRELDRAGYPVILVLTKVDWAKNPLTGSFTAPKGVQEFKEWLDNPVDHTGRPISVPVRRIVLTSTQSKHGKGEGHGLGELLEDTLALAPDSSKDAFRIAQQLNLPWKRAMARPVIGTAASAAAAAAAAPIPVADAVALAPIQMTMMGRISAIYGLELTTMLSGSALAQLATQVTGQALARSFLKLIPGAGSVINGSVAFGLTAATGEGWLRLCEQIHTGRIDLESIDEVWGDYAPSITSVIREMVTKRVRKR